MSHDPRHAYATARHDGSCYGSGAVPRYPDSSMGALDSFPTPSPSARQACCCAHEYYSYPTAQVHLPATTQSMMHPVPMAPLTPDAAAGHNTPASHDYARMPACYSFSGAAAPSQPATNGYLYGWSPTASNYSPMHPPAQPARGMQALMPIQPSRQRQQWQHAPHSVRDMCAAAPADSTSGPHAERPAAEPAEYSEKDSDVTNSEDDEASDDGAEDDDENAGGAERRHARARGAAHESSEVASMRAENERLRRELERRTMEMRCMSMHPPIPPMGTFGGSPFGAPSPPTPPPHAPSARTGSLRPPIVLAGETPAPPATTGFHGLSSAIDALAHGNRAPKLPWPDLPSKLMSNIQTKLPEDGVRTWLAVLHQHLEGACPGVKEFTDMDVATVHALLQETSHAGDVIRSMNAWLARQIVPLLDMAEGTRSARLVKEMTSKAHNFLQSGWHVHDTIRRAAEPRLRANRVALRRKLKGPYCLAPPCRSPHVPSHRPGSSIWRCPASPP